MEATLKTDQFFALIQAYLASGDGKDLVTKISGIFQVDLLEKKGGKVIKSWTIDLKNGSGSCSLGGNDKNNACFTITDDDFFLLAQGKLNPQMAFIQGKMKIKGSMSLATKFTPDLFPKATPEMIAKYTPKAKF